MPITRARDRVVNRGSEAFTVGLQVNRQIVFDVPMPSTDYELYWSTASPLTINVSATNKTREGFTIVVGIGGPAMTLKWVAVENVTS